ncbi:MAG: PstS family phosphate ABC transporter substrate-binding protein [Candidatus Nanopelagicales bacterium]
MKKNLIALVGILSASAILLSACGSDSDSSTSASTEETTEAAAALSGTIRIDGSSTVAPYSEVAAELFMNENPGVQVSVATSGTGGGFEKFCVGETDGSDASRLIKDEEAAICAENGIVFEKIQVANDGLSVVVNADNPIECLTTAQLEAIWTEGAALTTWGQIPGLEDSEVKDVALKLYGPGTDSGTFGYFTEEINGEDGKITTNFVDVGEDDNALITGVTGELGAMGYVGWTYYNESRDKVKALQVDGGNGCVAPELENVASGDYAPLGRGLYVYASDTSIARPEVFSFFQFYLDNQEAIASAAGGIPLTEAQYAENLALVNSLR